METAVCVLIKSNETNLRSIMRPLEWYGNASCRPRSVKLRIATRYPFSTNATGFQPPLAVRTSVSYSRYFIERPIEKDFQRVTLRFLWRDNRRLSINKGNVTGNEIYILFYFYFFSFFRIHIRSYSFVVSLCRESTLKNKFLYSNYYSFYFLEEEKKEEIM